VRFFRQTTYTVTAISAKRIKTPQAMNTITSQRGIPPCDLLGEAVETTADGEAGEDEDDKGSDEEGEEDEEEDPVGTELEDAVDDGRGLLVDSGGVDGTALFALVVLATGVTAGAGMLLTLAVAGASPGAAVGCPLLIAAAACVDRFDEYCPLESTSPSCTTYCCAAWRFPQLGADSVTICDTLICSACAM